MPTPTERINELGQLTATITERLDGVRREVEAVVGKCQRAEDSLHEVKRHVAIIEERLTEMKKGIEEAGRRRSAVIPSLVGAIIGGLITFLGQFALRRFFP
jgi:methyl-accepting chemotaxis protein